MDTSDDVAIVALVVSLFALVVAVYQFLQQIFGTAEGYRRCKKEVIGPWAANTHRKFHWYELRLETTYVVPDIDLLSQSQFEVRSQELQGKKMGPYRLDAGPEEIYRTLHPSNDDKSELDPDNELLVSWIPFLRELHKTYNDYWRRSSDHSSCYITPAESIRTKYVHSGRPGREPTMKSPLRLQRSMAGSTSSLQSATSSLKAKKQLVNTDNLQSTEVAIVYRKLSWDFMPPDVVRPLAMTHLGALVVMARRLGMRWQELDLRNAALRASGNGRNLTSTSIRGLGIVVQFSPNLGDTEPDDLIPSKAVDKMMCGILPGCAELGIRDYPLIGDDGKVSNVRDLLEDLHVPHEIREDMADDCMAHRLLFWERNKRRTPFNDAVILLCPFLPMDTNGNKDQRSRHAVQFLGWLGMMPCSVFTYHEPKMILLSESTKRVQSHADPTNSIPHIDYVQKALANLEKTFADFFYSHFLSIERHPCERRHGRNNSNTSRQDLIKQCREYFETTTSFFTRVQRGQRRQPLLDEVVVDRPPSATEKTMVRPPLPYSEIVGAHASFGKRAASWVRDETGKFEHDSYYLTKFGGLPCPDDVDPEERNIDVRVPTVMDVVWAYVERKWDFIDEIRRRLKESSGLLEKSADVQPFTDDEIEEMWWMLMLRGVTWAMSVRIEVRDEVIPSSYYENRTPIWIT